MLQQKPKILTQVEIPPNLRVFLEEVAYLIEVGDEKTTIESCDLLQCEYAYDGLCEEGVDEYGFTYSPGYFSLLEATEIRNSFESGE